MIPPQPHRDAAAGAHAVATAIPTKEILGVRSTVVRDTVSSHGKPIERTFDWYAQDKDGNVWYMG